MVFPASGCQHWKHSSTLKDFRRNLMRPTIKSLQFGMVKRETRNSYVVWKIAKDRAVTLSRADPLGNPTEEQTEANKDVQNPMATPISCFTESASPTTSQALNNQVRATENSPSRQERLVHVISPGTSKDDDW